MWPPDAAAVLTGLARAAIAEKLRLPVPLVGNARL